MADSGQKTEQPTERRLQKARQDGQFASSRELVNAIPFLAFVFALGLWGAPAFRGSVQWMRSFLEQSFRGVSGSSILTPAALRTLVLNMVLPAMSPLLYLLAGMALLTLAVQLLLTRFGLAPNRLAPDIGRLSPLKNLGSLARQTLPQFVRALVVLGFTGWAVYRIGQQNWAELLALPSLTVNAAVVRTGRLLLNLLLRGAFLFLLVGAGDYAWQLTRHRKQLRMSKQEIRDEIKEQEGRPEVKARIRRIQRDLLRRKMMQEVPKATAVIVNPTHYAVAIRYQLSGTGDGQQQAPKVIAKGKNYLALRIRQKALDHQVPIVENPPLARSLYSSAEVGQEIPPHLYRAVAEVLAYIFRLMNGRLPG